jgi:hypothetical protein
VSWVPQNQFESRSPFSFFSKLLLGWWRLSNSVILLYRFQIFLLVMFIASSLILSSRYSLFFPECLLISRLLLLIISKFIWLGFFFQFQFGFFPSIHQLWTHFIEPLSKLLQFVKAWILFSWDSDIFYNSFPDSWYPYIHLRRERVPVWYSYFNPILFCTPYLF